MADTIIQESLSDKVYTIIKRQILSGELPGGTMLREEAYAEQFGVSRTPIREALRRLSEYGLVSIKPRSQAVVHQVTEKEFSDITHIRYALETLVIESLFTIPIEMHLKRLVALADECTTLAHQHNRAQLFVKDSEFHLDLAKTTGNKALFDLYNRLDAKVQLIRVAQNLADSDLSNTIDQHYQLLDALESHDKTAGLNFIQEHIHNVSFR